MSGFGELFLATFLFVGSHFVLASPPLRRALCARLGEPVFQGLYSAVAGVTLLWAILAFVRSPFEPLWNFGPSARHLAMGVMPIALLFFVCAVSQRNPTAIGQAMPSATEEPARGILAVTRHPLMWAFALWAIVHLIANGEVAVVILFGGILVLALGGAVALDAKRRARDPDGFARLAAATSYIPLAAIFAGRARLRLADIGWRRIAIAIAAYVALLFLHPFISGGRALL